MYKEKYNGIDIETQWYMYREKHNGIDIETHNGICIGRNIMVSV